MFPTTIPCDLSGCIVVSLNDVDVSTIHYISALIMFAALAYMCLVLFRKKSANPTNQKITRNWIYLINGILIVLSIIAIYLFQTMWDAEKLCNIPKLDSAIACKHFRKLHFRSANPFSPSTHKQNHVL